MSQQFEIRKVVDVPVAAEVAWRAVATEQGQAGWSPDPYAAQDGHTVEAHAPSQLSVRTPTGPNGAFHHFEYRVDATDTGSSVTFIHSGDLGDDWQALFDFELMTSHGWDIYLHNLREYLTRFTDRPAVFVTGQAPETANTHAAWEQLEQALGLSGQELSIGDAVRLAPEGLPVLDGVVDYVQPGEDFLGVRSDDGLYRFHSLERMGMPIAFGHYVYQADGETVTDRQTLQDAWQSWINGVFN